MNKLKASLPLLIILSGVIFSLYRNPVWFLFIRHRSENYRRENSWIVPKRV